MKKIVVFASGSGSNFQSICDFFQYKKRFEVVALVCNNEKAGVIALAKKYQVDTTLVNLNFFQSEDFLNELNILNPDLLVLAGFLWKIPNKIVKNFRNRIINIHPSLLPKYGGKGMYGINIHKAVIKNKEKQSGLTIHYVNEEYDKGGIIFQKIVDVDVKTPEELSEKILKLEHRYYPEIIKKILYD